ncbi:uncharacterized protein [Medicago truncatula]|nr:uncharacterized protein LOC112422905 [Medicago truncatula]XP_024642454.1 uncharacterized protein LOC112422905 [Medicago truncatula]
MEEHITLILHHGGDLVRNENRRLQYVGGEFCVWEKIYVDELCLWDIEKMVKHCKSYFKVSKLGYMKPYEGVANDLNICLTPLTTDQHILDILDGNEEPVCGSQMKKTYNDTQCGRCGLLGHNARSCMMQGVSRRPKENPGNVDAVDENAGNVDVVDENAGNVDAVDENAGNTPNEVLENAPNFVPGNAPNEVPENVVPTIDPNEVPANVVPENAPYFVQHNVVAHAGQSLAPRRYGLRGPVPSANRPKNTPTRGPAPAHPTPAGMIRVPYPTYGPPGSTQPQFMEFIPTPGFSKK